MIMPLLLWFLVLMVVSLSCAFVGTSLRIWTGAVAAVLLGVSIIGPFGWIGPSLLWLVFLMIAVPINYPPWRRTLISAPVLKFFATLVPRISETERIALDAGTVGFEGELFTGSPDWHQLIGRPLPELSTEEQAFLDGPVEQLCDLIDEWEFSHHRIGPSEAVWAHLKKHRFFAIIIPEDYGGLGFSATGHRAVLEKVCGMSTTVGPVVVVPNSLGPAELLLHYGTDRQKAHYLPRLARGEEIPCFALTSTTAGSDATSIGDYGIVCKGIWQGEEVLGMRLTFDKRYITLAPVATLIGLAFRLYDPDRLLGATEDIGISLALLPRSTPGLEIGRHHLPLNNPFPNGPVRGKDVFVPLDCLLGGVDYAGQGWRMLVESLSAGRAISLPAAASGQVKTVALVTGAYARIRKQFNLPIGRFEGVEEALARIAGYTYALSAVSRQTAAAVDQGERPAVAGAIAKYHATELCREVVKDAMDIHGGKGVILGPRNYLGRGWQALPIWITVEGANILTRSMMIFGQGSIRCHPFALKELQALQEPDPRLRLKRFDRLLFAHLGHTLRCMTRSLVLGLSFGRFTVVPGDRRTRRYYRKLERYSASFALLADVALLTYGGRLKQKEKLSGRLADALSWLYIAAAMLRRFEHEGRRAADQPILAWAFHDAVYRIQEALKGVIDNYPFAPLRPVLRRIVFPLGANERRPNDRLGHKVAQLLLSPSETRDRLTRGGYRSDRNGYPVGVIEQLLPEVIAIEPLERKLLKAIRSGPLAGYTFAQQVTVACATGVLTAAEAERLSSVRERVLAVLAVDDFELETLQAGVAEPERRPARITTTES